MPWVLRPATLVLVGALTAPALAQTPVLQNAIEQRDHWRGNRVGVYMNDFGERGRYRRANAALKAPAPGERRVVFLGDSITDLWALETAFPGKPYVNRGISGQTTAQMLVRFRQDVLDLKPKAVVLLAGTNDIAGNSGPVTDDEIEGNYSTMAELCRAHGIALVLASIVPVHNYTPQSQLAFALRPPDRIAALNRWLKAAAAAGGHVYLDYFTAMVDDHGLLRRELAEDGLHPNQAGYAIMARLAGAAIAKALAAPTRSTPPAR
jgi:lysophospholipase L1-like esterase